MTTSYWYYSQNGQSFGPLDVDSLRAMIASGTVAWHDHVWKPGMSQWMTAATVPEFAGNVGGAALPQVAYPTSSAYEPRGYAQGVYVPPGVPTTAASMNYYTPQFYTSVAFAGFWLRFCAFFIDGLVLAIPIIAITLGVCVALRIPISMLVDPNYGIFDNPTIWVRDIVGIVIGWIYFGLMESSPTQATLGKMALGLKVTDERGQRIGFGRASGRQLGKIISALIVYIGFIMAGLTGRKQALHDIMAGCLVIRSR